MIEMTKREKDVFDYVVLYRGKFGRSPSVREITAGIGLHSTGSVYYYIKRLTEKGGLLLAAEKGDH